MLNLNLFRNIGFPLYLFIYLILSYSAITQTLKVDYIRNLENSLNSRDLEFIRKNFRNEESQNIPKQFSPLSRGIYSPIKLIRLVELQYAPMFRFVAINHIF